MTAMLLTFGIFAAWTLVGLGLLTILRADTRSLMLVLTAPVLGVSLITLLTFGLSRAGLAVHDFAAAETVTLLVGAAVVLAWRRPPVEWTAALPFGIALAAMLLVASPMLDLGFRWIANANDDMANYVLAAERLLRHGFWDPIDVNLFVSGRDYTAAAQSLQAAGARPGSQLILAWLEGVSGHNGQEAFMPLIVGLQGCALCAGGALAAQASRRLLAALLAVAVLAVAPLATFGIIQQLVAQTFGLAVGAALAAILMRPELHERAASTSDIVLIGFLTASLALAYVEIGAIFLVAYVIFVVTLAAQRRLRLRAVATLWATAAAVALLLLNTYAVSLVRFVGDQSGAGTASTGDSPLFGFMFVPSAVPSVLGLRAIPFGGLEHINFWIVSSLMLLALILVSMVVALRRGYATGFVLLTMVGVAIGLLIVRADFGLFKLAMWLQPFVAVTVAVAIAQTRRLNVQLAAVALALLWLVAAVETERDYVAASRNPVELRHGSDATVFPAFRRVVQRTDGPIVSATANPVLAKLEGSMSLGHQVLFLGREMYRNLLIQLSGGSGASSTFRREARLAGRRARWMPRRFALNEGKTNLFGDNQRANAALSVGDCTLVVAGGSQVPLNRRRFPEGSPDLVARPCGSYRNVLVFVSSKLGQNYYLPATRERVSLYQLENDVYFSGRTFAGAGRYALFQVLRPTGALRLCLALTRTLARDGANFLPPVTVVGENRATFRTLGRGSARVCSSRVVPRRIGGQAYVMLDMGIDGRPPNVPRPGLLGLYGKGFQIDPRFLTSYVRDISLLRDDARHRAHPPVALRSFPAALDNEQVEYSGIYEDGWVAEHSYALLGRGPAADLIVEGDTLGPARRLVVSVDGRALADRRVGPGAFKLRLRGPGSSQRRRVELRFWTTRLLPSPDDRPISARVSFLGFAP